VRERASDALQKLDGKDAGVGLNDAQRHHRVNFPCSIAGKMASPVCFLIFERMTHIEKRLAGNGDDGSLIERQVLSRASVKRE
jgi:hypothetical protein